MSFGAQSPPPFVPPAAPPAVPPLSPTGAKPPKKAMQPSVIGAAMDPSQQQTGGRSLIGGAPTSLGT